MQIFFNSFDYHIKTAYPTDGSKICFTTLCKNQKKEQIADEQKLYRFKPIVIHRDSTN